MTRPLERLGIAELEEFFKKPGQTSVELKNLEEELSFRTTVRSEKLLKAVKSRIKINEIMANAKAVLAAKKTVQLELPSVAEFELIAGAVEPSAQLAVRPAVPVPVAPQAELAPQTRPPVAPVPAIAPEQAFKFLKISPSASWEQIESSRRELVAKGQPDRLMGLAAEKRKELQDECKQVNAAYKALLQFKT